MLKKILQNFQSADIEQTAWGPANRLSFPVTIEGCIPAWNVAAGHFCSKSADWLT